MKAKNKKTSVAISKPIKRNRYAFLIFGLVFLFYFQTKNFELAHFDDDVILTRIEESIYDPDIYARALTTDAMLRHSDPFYRPLQNISFITDLKISGISKTWMLHLTNVIIFSLIGVVLFYFLLKINVSVKLAFFASLVYSFHPILVSSVAWIPARGDLFMTLFVLLSFIYYISFLEEKSYLRLFLCSIFFMLALFSKETAAFLPFLFLFYFLLQKPIKIETKHILLASLMFVFGLIWYFIRRSYIGAELDETTYSNEFWDVLSNIQFIPTGLSLFFFPSDFTTIPAYTPFKLIAGTLIIALFMWFILKKTNQPIKHKLFYFSWYIVFLIPSFLIKQRFFDYLDHRFLLPSVGIIVLLIFCIPQKHYFNGEIKNTWVYYVLIIILAFLSLIKLQPYKTGIEFCNASITNNYKQAVALNNRATIHHNSMNFEDALIDYNEALQVNPNYVLAYVNRGGTKFMLKDYKGAIADFTEDIKRNKNPKNSFYFRSLSLANLGFFNLAIKDMQKYILIAPQDKFAYYHLGRILSVVSKPKQAINSFNNAIKIDPAFCEAYAERANIYYRLGQFNEALVDCDMALRINPNDKLALKIKEQASFWSSKTPF